DAQGKMLEELQSGTCEQAQRIAEIVQRCEVDVLLLCELDHDAAAESAKVFAEQYLAKSQRGLTPIQFEYRYCAPVNTGEPSGLDLDGDGKTDGPGDAWGFGRFPGQYGMVLLSRYPILVDEVRTFQTLPWSRMPEARRPANYYSDEVWKQLRLSSKSHWDVPIGIGPVENKRIVHVLCSHPTPPVFDGAEDRNGCRNHDEIRFWVDYLSPGKADWIVDDAGRGGGLAAAAEFVLMGDLNCDPVDGDAQRDALALLRSHPRVFDPEPKGPGGAEQSQKQWGMNASQKGDPALDTGDFPDAPEAGPGNLRLDYVLVSRGQQTYATGVFWPPAYDPAIRLVEASDHRLTWVDVGAQ
ncbi:MAG: endonuclease/exonuclease/phosphatase family protein, partial [Planctomycetes bacterium]|nr:endonuclease/exonuclease/phosphatase family protein [Planctomycetota bacterium]